MLICNIFWLWEGGEPHERAGNSNPSAFLDSVSLLRLWIAIATLHPISETFESPKKTGKHLLLSANCQTGRSQSWRKLWGMWCYLWFLLLWLLAGIDHGHATLECKELYGLCWTSLGFLTWTLGIAKGMSKDLLGVYVKRTFDDCIFGVHSNIG